MNLTETLLRIQKNTHWANVYMPLEWPIPSGLKWAHSEGAAPILGSPGRPGLGQFQRGSAPGSVWSPP